MTASEPRQHASFDAGRLDDALDRINRARRLSSQDPGRLHALLDGFQSVLQIEPERPSLRDTDASGALSELEELLEAAGAESPLVELQALLEPVLDRLIEGLLAFPETRLAAYGSLVPGQANHRQVATLVGEWSRGFVTGSLHDLGWAAREGFPAFVWEPTGDPVEVQVLESAALTNAWDRLDAFEGAGYRRILAPVELPRGRLVCYLYELADATPAS